MKKTKLALAVSLATLLATGCGSSSSGSDPIDTDPTCEELGTCESAAPIAGNSVAIVDTSATIDEDLDTEITGTAGQLTHILDTALTTGSVSVKVKYPTDGDQTAYLTLFDEAIKSATQIANIKMKTSSSTVGLKRATSSSSSDDAAIETSFTPDVWATLEISWTAADYTLVLDGKPLGTWNKVNNLDVAAIQVKFGNNDDATEFTLYVDDLVITDGTDELWNDDFDAETVDADVATLSGYESKTNQATITDLENGSAAKEEDETPGDGEEPTVSEDFEDYAPGVTISDVGANWNTNNIKNGSIAAVSDEAANGGDNSLYLYDGDAEVGVSTNADYYKGSKPSAYLAFTGSDLTAGTVTFDIYTPDTNEKVTYVNIGTGKNNSDRYFELRINGDDLEYENSATGDVDLAENGFTTDAWHTVSISWTVDNMVTVTLDGVSYGAINQTTLGLDATTVGYINIYTGDDNSSGNEVYIDNITSTLL